MKLPWEWNESDILELITNQVPESLTLDYKACGSLARTDAKKKEISKDVSAFANSAGGTIVYGVLEDKHAPVGLDVGYLPTEINKEWLEQIINTNIQRRIDGVRITSVPLTGSSVARTLYVVSVPQSIRAPHMAVDHKFYKRFNFESIPMEEYEVRDTGRRSEAPDLKLTLHWYSSDPLVPFVDLDASISNDAPEPANHVVIRLYVDARLPLISSAGLGAAQDHILTGVHGDVRVKVFSLNWSPLTKMSIWEGEAFRLTEGPMRFGLPGQGEYIIGWRLSAPRMSPRQQFYSVVSNGIVITGVLEHPRA